MLLHWFNYFHSVVRRLTQYFGEKQFIPKRERRTCLIVVRVFDVSVSSMGVVGITKACLGFIFFLVLTSPSLIKPSLADEDEKCGPVSVHDCFKKIQTFLRLSKLPYATEEKELDELCRQSVEGYNCSTWMFNNPGCLTPKDKELLPVFISIAQYTFFMLCGDMHSDKGYLREAFLGYSGCILENQKKMDCCADGSSVPDLPVLRILEDSSKSLAAREIQTCCPLSRYLQCTSAVARENCGDAAANFTQEYIRRAAGEQTQLVCQKIPSYPDPDPVTCQGPLVTCTSGCARSQMLNGLMLFAVGLASILRFFKSL